MESVFGTLEVKVLSANFSRSTSSWSKMDPYFVMEHEIKGEVLKTTPHKNGSKKPVWNQSFSIVVDDLIMSTLVFNLKIFDSNKYSKDNLIGQHSIDISCIKEIKKLEGMDYKLYHQNKEIGKVYLNFDFQDYSQIEPEDQIRFSGYQSRESIPYQQENQDRIDNDMNYEYSPDGNNEVEKVEYNPNGNVNPFEVNQNAPQEVPDNRNVIKIDESLSPLDANLSINKTALWFKFDSKEVYHFDFDNIEYNSVFIDNPQYLSLHFRVAELPDSSFLITGGCKDQNYSSQTLHFLQNVFYK